MSILHPPPGRFSQHTAEKVTWIRRVKVWSRLWESVKGLAFLPVIDSKTATIRQARQFLLFLGVTLLLAIMTSLYFDLRGLEDEYRTLAAEMGRSFYQAIDTMREWNLEQGGIYVREPALAHSTPNLLEPLRDLDSNAGAKLRLINHAQMTRLLSDLLGSERGISLHITGQEPLGKGNKPDDWEWRALNRFAGGGKEEYAVIGKGDGSVFRYMAPLRTGPACVSCHPTSARAPLSVLGGISISFPYAPFTRVMAAERNRLLALHAIFFSLGLGVIILAGGKLIRGIRALQDSILRIKRLEGLLPICVQCKKVRLKGAERTRQDSWVALEQYIQDHTDAEFSHGLCPLCAHELYPTIFHSQSQ